VRLRELARRYGDRVAFLNIYVREAHPLDGWSFQGPVSGPVVHRLYPRVALDVVDPRTLEERRAVARRCERALDLRFPTVVDDVDDDVCRAYAALPTRLYLIGVDGRVVYAGGLGPWGFEPAELGDAIETYLARVGRQEAAA
jgi:hypothetical protein